MPVFVYNSNYVDIIYYMNNFDLIDESIERILKLSAGNSFVVNGKWRCTIVNDRQVKWTKDCNSSAMMAEIHVDALLENNLFDGILAIQSDMSLSHKYYAELCIKKDNDTTWQHMFTVVDISFD